MGGRGAVSGFVSKIPNADKATIADSKITKFLLDPEKSTMLNLWLLVILRMTPNA